jgi:tRNA threonylcarbamoyladenosine modification (KEOPS) complex Cgi121 subunit
LIRKYHIKSVVIPGLLNTIDEEPSMKEKEAKREIGRIMKAVAEISGEVLVVTSIQREGKYADWVLSEFKKHINLIDEKDGRITAELNNQGERKTVSLVEQDLKIIHARVPRSL